MIIGCYRYLDTEITDVSQARTVACGNHADGNAVETLLYDLRDENVAQTQRLNGQSQLVRLLLRDQMI